MLGCRRGIGDGHHLCSQPARFGGHRPDLDVTLDRSDVPDVDGRDASGMLSYRLQVDLRVLLPRVADQDEREILVGAEEATDHPHLVVPVLPENTQAPVFEKQRPGRNAVHIEEVYEHVVDVPGAAGDVEDRVGGSFVCAQLQGSIEGGHTLERQTRVGDVEDNYQRNLHYFGRAGVDHRIVEVADHTELGRVRHEYMCRRPYLPPTRRRWRKKIQLDAVPAGPAIERLSKL